MSRRCSCGIPGCRVGPIDSWSDLADDWLDRWLDRWRRQHAEKRRAAREAEILRRQARALRRLVTDIERDRRERDPNLN